MSAFMNKWQAAVCATYGGGDYRHLRRSPRWKDALDDVGDGLFRFLMIELSSGEDCTDAATALRRLASAQADIDTAIAAVTALNRH
ncbi:hypothetical protein [Hyphomicrobium sp. DY-1]|uniref:hypothetical protein n=1 Tax=Hyphomicrobium sp. DY-1 TaxID=3075650 RepID=UPI0039C3AB9B